MINENEWLVVGLITSPHGINGKVKVKSLSDFEERFIKPGLRWLQKENEFPAELELTSGFKQPGKETFIISFKGINTRNKANELTATLRAFEHKKNMGLIFPAWLMHFVPPVVSSRISISWNVLLRGKYGEPNTLQNAHI